MKITTCRSCGARVFWARTDRGRLMPLDETPTPEGQFAVGRTSSGDLIARHRSKIEDLDPFTELYTCHFNTCPDAPVWRRRNGKEQEART